MKKKKVINTLLIAVFISTLIILLFLLKKIGVLNLSKIDLYKDKNPNCNIIAPKGRL